MTQQYYDPNAGQYGAPQGYQPPPQQGYPQQGGYPAPPYQPQQQNPYPPQGYAQPGPYGAAPIQQGYPGQQMMQPQGPPPQDLSGDLDTFFAQRQTGGGKGISWKGVPDGYTIQGVVARPITDGDVFKETHPPNSPQAGQLRTNRDGSFKYAMQVPLKLQWLDQLQQQTYPDGEARLFLRGGLRDEMTRAMAEVGALAGAPEAGAFVRVTLTHRKPGNNIATNVFAVVYRSPGTWENGQAPAPQQAPQQAPYQQQAPAQYAAPAQAAPNPQQYAQGAPGPAYGPNQYAAQQYGQPAANDPNQATQYGQPAAQQQYAAPGSVAAPNPQYAQQGQPQAPNTQAPAGAVNPGDQAAYHQPQLPINQPPAGPPVQNGVQPSALDPGRQALLARISAQQQGQNPAVPQG